MKEKSRVQLFEGIKNIKENIVFMGQLHTYFNFLFLEKQYGLYFNLLISLKMHVFKCSNLFLIFQFLWTQVLKKSQ